MNKSEQLIHAKLDALLEKAGLKPAEIVVKPAAAPAAAPRKLTPAEQQAIDNAPKAPAALPPQRERMVPRTDPVTNAPTTASSTPPAPPPMPAKK